MNRNLFPKYVSKLLILGVLVGGLVFLLNDKTLGFDYPQFDSCMASTHGQFDSCIWASRVNFSNCPGTCNPNAQNYQECLQGCNTTYDSNQTTCSLNYNSSIWSSQPINCNGIPVPNHARIAKRCRTESSRMYDKCVLNANGSAAALGCLVNGQADINCCAQAEANNIQSCLYP